VLGGHGHSHGPEEHSHGGHDHDHEHGSQSHDDDVRAAEEGLYLDGAAADESGRVADVLPEAAVARATHTPDRHIKFSHSDESASTSRVSHSPVKRSNSKSSRNHRRRASSIRANRLANIEDQSIHPASFRQDIIAASRPQLDGIHSDDGSGAEEDALVDTDDLNETSPLLCKGNSDKQNGNGHAHDHNKNPPRHDSWHAEHNHNKPKKAAASHGHNHGDMGMRAMVLHVIGDALGNAGVITAALIIWLTDSPYRFYADPAVSLFITLIILKSTIPLTKATAKILLQATPDHLDVNDIKQDIQDIPGVVSCHHVHIWQLSDSQIIASMHIQVAFPLQEEGGSERYMELAKAARKCLHAYGIHSATIQPEFCLDSKHQHTVDAVNLDGVPARLQVDNDSCLLECVDDCEEQGCCQTSASKASTKSSPPESHNGDAHHHDHDEHDGHNHTEHDGHNH
jgi:zinc transporter 1